MNCCKLCLYHTRDTPALERKESEAGFPCGPEFLVPLADVQTGQALPEARARQGWGTMVQLPSLLWGAVLLLLQCESASCRCQDSPGMGGLLAKVLSCSPPNLDLCMQGTEERHTPRSRLVGVDSARNLVQDLSHLSALSFIPWVQICRVPPPPRPPVCC